MQGENVMLFGAFSWRRDERVEFEVAFGARSVFLLSRLLGCCQMVVSMEKTNG